METNLYLADGAGNLARNHIQDLLADADNSRRTKQARFARRTARKAARARRG
jgi:hypothetical protein